MATTIGNNLNVVQGNTTSFNRSITATDLDGNQVVVVYMYCTIISGKSFNIYADVQKDVVYQSNKEVIDQQVSEFNTEARQMAVSLNVPFVNL